MFGRSGEKLLGIISNAGVLDHRLLEQLKPFLSSITPRAAVFDHNYVKRIDGPHVKKGKTKADMVEALRQDIRNFKQSSGASRLVAVWCGSTRDRAHVAATGSAWRVVSWAVPMI